MLKVHKQELNEVGVRAEQGRFMTHRQKSQNMVVLKKMGGEGV